MSFNKTRIPKKKKNTPTNVTTLTIIFSISILIFSFILTVINWKILKVSKTIRDISALVLSETVVIKDESIRVRVVSEEVLEETIKMRKALDMPEEPRGTPN